MSDDGWSSFSLLSLSEVLNLVFQFLDLANQHHAGTQTGYEEQQKRNGEKWHFRILSHGAQTRRNVNYLESKTAVGTAERVGDICAG